MTKRSPLVGPEPEGPSDHITLDASKIITGSITANRLHISKPGVQVTINPDGSMSLIQDPLNNVTFETPEDIDDDATEIPSFLERINPFRKKKS